MELQDGKMERKRFIICYLSFYFSIVSVYFSLKFIFVIVWAAKIGKFWEKKGTRIIKYTYCSCLFSIQVASVGFITSMSIEPPTVFTLL